MSMEQKIAEHNEWTFLDRLRQEFGIECVVCHSKGPHGFTCSLRSEALYELTHPSDEKRTEIAEGRFSDEDLNILLYDRDLLDVIEHTIVSDEIRELCQKEMQDEGYGPKQ